MANPNPNYASRFVAGQSGNPRGRPPLLPELRAIRELSGEEVGRLVAKCARMTRDDLLASLEDQATSIVELAIASSFARAIKDGDPGRLNLLLDRAIGRAQTAGPLITEQDMHRAELAELTSEELLHRGREAMQGLEAQIQAQSVERPGVGK